jgi:hypothetical protein
MRTSPSILALAAAAAIACAHSQPEPPAPALQPQSAGPPPADPQLAGQAGCYFRMSTTGGE